MNTRIRRLAFASLLLACGATGATAQSGAYPNKPVRIITHSAAGGAPDVQLRIVAERLTQIWGEQIVVLNQPGAGGAIAARAAAATAPDGYTLYAPAASAFVTLPGLQAKLPLEVPRDFEPIGHIGEQPMFITANPALGVSTLPELIALAKKKPGQISFAATGRGTLTHLTGEAFKALAVGSPKRLPDFPDIPAIAETLPGFNSRGWLVLVAPLGTPKAIVQKVSADLRMALADPVVVKKLATLGNYVVPMSPSDVEAYVQGEQQMWRPVVEKVLATGPN